MPGVSSRSVFTNRARPRIVPVPASTSQTLSLSALACCVTDSTFATTTPLKGGATGRVSSTSMPAMVSSSDSSAVEIGGSQNSRSQDSGNCMELVLS